MEQTLDNAKQILKKYNQEHLLNNYEKLTYENKEKILEQILGIDFEEINKLYQSTKNKEAKDKDVIEPTPYIDKNLLSHEELERYKQKGVEEIKKGQLAVITMAGRTTEQG